MGDLVEDMWGWQDLPAGVLQVIASQLLWNDMLSSRLVCAHWRAATATLITQLRVHVAPGCSNTAVNVKCEFQSCKQGADAAVQDWQNPNTVVPAAQQNPCRVVATVLRQLPRVTAVQLVLTERTTASDLEDVLAVVGQQSNVHDVSIWEVDPICKSLQVRGYAASLQLHKLQHVRHMTIRSSVTWSLQDIWQQVAAMATSSGRTGSSSSGSSGTALQGSKQGTMYPDVSRSDYVMDSGSVAVMQQPDASSSSSSSSSRSTQQQHQCFISTPPALASLTVQSVSLLSQGQTCSISTDAAFPPHLRRLTTPLPGQHNSSGAVVGTIHQSHAQYVLGLAAALPLLESLKVIGHYEGEMEPFESMAGLTDLQMTIGGLMRSMLQAFIDDNSLSEPAAGCTKQLLHLPKLQRLALETTYGGVAPVRLDWLQGAKQLRHLAAYVDPTAPAPGAASVGQLQSLTCRLTANMTLGQAALLLDHIVAVGGQLTQLCISRGDPSTPTMRRPSRIQRPSLALQPALPAFTHLASLSLLSGPERMPFTIREPAGVWRRLPLLRELRMQGVGLGYNADGTLPTHKTVVAVPKHTLSSLPLGLHGTSGVLQSPAAGDPTTSMLQQQLEEYLTLWLDDLPLNLHKLELIRYVIVCGGQQQQQEAAAVISSGGGGGTSSSSGASCLGGAFGRLECLSLAACCLVQVTQGAPPHQPAPVDTHRPAGSRSATLMNGRVTSIPAAVKCAFVQLASPMLLMQRVPPSCCKLRELHMLQVPFARSDVQCICDQLGANLQLLRLQPADWCDAAGTLMQYALAKNAAAHAAALADGAESGRLRQLRSLSLDCSNLLSCGWSPLNRFEAAGSASSARSGSSCGSSGSGSVSAAGGLGVELCRIACGFSGLRQLLVLDVQHCAITLAGSGSSNSDNAGSSSSGSGVKGHDILPLQPITSSSASTVSAALQLQEQQQHIGNALKSWLCSCHGVWQLSNLAQLRVLDITLHVPAVRVMGDLGPGALGRCRQCGGGVGLEAVRWFFKQAVPWELPTCEVRYEEVSSSGGW